MRCLALTSLLALAVLPVLSAVHGQTAPCCSPFCTCGCNQGGACPCTGRPAPQPPAPAPAPEQPDESATRPPSEPLPTWATHGVAADKIGGGEQYHLNGKAVSRQQALDALTSGNLTDDSAKLRLTVIGTEPDRKAVVGDLRAAPALAEFRERLLVQDYPPEHWAVRDAGFVTTGKPTIYLQAPSGKVLHRQDDYQGGAEELAQAIRKADPNYRPEKDRDLRKPDVLPTNWLQALLTLLAGLLPPSIAALLPKR